MGKYIKEANMTLFADLWSFLKKNTTVAAKYMKPQAMHIHVPILPVMPITLGTKAIGINMMA